MHPDLIAPKYARPHNSVMLSCQACLVNSLLCGYADEVGKAWAYSISHRPGSGILRLLP